METWKTHGNPTIWDRISALKYSVVEPQDKVEFTRAFGGVAHELKLV